MNDYDSARTRLEALIKNGVDPERATSVVLEEIPKSWRGWVRGFVLREARGIESRVSNAVLHDVIQGNTVPVGGVVTVERSARFAMANKKLRQTVYHAADGARVLWDEMTLEQIEAKIAWMRKHIGSLTDHLFFLEEAQKLCANHAVSRLGDIEGWVELVQQSAKKRRPEAA